MLKRITEPLNWTLLELKHKQAREHIGGLATLNWTLLELKPRTWAIGLNNSNSYLDLIGIETKY